MWKRSAKELSKFHTDNLNYSIVKFVFPNREVYTLWYTDDIDGFLLTPDNSIVMPFSSESEVRLYSEARDLHLDKEIAEFTCDFGALLPESGAIDCDIVLSFWNIVSDFARSIRQSFSGDQKDPAINALYDKLFYGCNLPAINTTAREFVPIFDREESQLLQSIVSNGLQILDTLSI